MVSFQTTSNYDPNDTANSDIYVGNTITNILTWTSKIPSTGLSGNGNAFVSNLSGDGRYVVFHSQASNLVASDANGGGRDAFRYDTQTQALYHVSTTSAGLGGNSDASSVDASYDGQYVAFQSVATNLVAGDTNALADVFRKDCTTGAIVRVSESSSGVQATGSSSSDPKISPDGRYVIFHSSASNLHPNDPNTTQDVFVKDLNTGAIYLVSSSSSGTVGNATSTTGDIGFDGTDWYAVFLSSATNLVAGDTNVVADIFIKNLSTGAVALVSTTSAGVQANGASITSNGRTVTISDDARYVAFRSDATNLVAGDTNAQSDIFVKDRITGAIARVSIDANLSEANATNENPQISGDGKWVTFTTWATNLITPDRNGTRDTIIARNRLAW